ncbi:GNAT family N-acetyltransferase [Pseudonocardia sp. NPDC049635]|uniref:GNAT family N-acetyltransferase n=1 Tax=Pseudonocardia sp. NPDC049635 TaxID=3155506 RepID=UPI0033E25554
MTTTVHRLGPDDWRLAREARLASVREGFGADSAFLREEAGLEEAAWRDVLARHVRFAARSDDDPVGTACWRPTGDRDEGQLYGMWVCARARGTGLADTLVDAVVAVAREHGRHRLSLKVEPGNARALAFYRRIGFRQVPAGDGPAALVVMTRDLGPR